MGEIASDGSVSTPSTPFTLTLTRDAALSLNEGSVVRFEAYPNPVTDVLNVKIDSIQSSDLSIVLYDISGRSLYQTNTKENKTRATAINTRRTRSNETVKILLDSGASASIVNHSYVHKNSFSTKSTTQKWSTMAGTFNTRSIL